MTPLVFAHWVRNFPQISPPYTDNHDVKALFWGAGIFIAIRFAQDIYVLIKLLTKGI